MMGERRVDQGALFYEFSLERHVPADHLLRAIDRFVDLEGLRAHLASFYSPIGRPSVDPELLIRMLLVGYCFGIRSERRLCEEVHLNLAYRWFCRLGLDGEVPDHSTFSKNRHGRFRESDLLRQLFETVVRCRMAEGLVGGEGFAVDASLIKADANRQRCVPGAEGLPPEASSRAVDEDLAVLDEAAFGAATPVTPKFISPADPASRWTGANKGLAFFAYATNYLIDLDHAVIVDVEASTAVRQAEVTAARTMIERVREQHHLSPQRLAADTAYGSAEMLDWLVNQQEIEPHIPVIDKSNREDGTLSRSDFTYDEADDLYRCPGGKELKRHRRAFSAPRIDPPPDDTLRYRATKVDCDECPLKTRCCPNTPARKVTRSIHEAARDFARNIAKITGVKASTPGGDLTIEADLVVGADGRRSVVRRQAGLPVKDLGAAIDVLWFPAVTGERRSRGDHGQVRRGAHLRTNPARRALAVRLRHPRGRGRTGAPPRPAGVSRRHRGTLPFAAERLSEITCWDDVKLLSVGVGRLVRWRQPGLLCIGDAAHTMSPVGGVGINLAIQDAVAAANLLAGPLKAGALTERDLVRV